MKRLITLLLLVAASGYGGQTDTSSNMEGPALRQRAAAQLQMPGAPGNGFFTTGWSGPPLIPPPLSFPDCPAIPEEDLDLPIRDSAARYKLNPDLIRAVIRQESGFHPCAVSEKGAIGLMQIMPATADLFKVEDPFDPAQNIKAGSAYLRKLLTRFHGDLPFALAAYNAGPEKVDGPVPSVPRIAETRDYIARITDAMHGAPAEPVDPAKR